MFKLNEIMLKKTTLAVILLVVLGGIAAYSYSNKPSKTLKVGVSQIVSHQIFDEFKSGIIQGFKNGGYEDGKNIIFDFQNANGDMNVNQVIAQKFAASDYDLFMPMGTQSGQAIANLEKKRPIIFAGITDPVTAGLVASKEKPGSNITGTSDIVLYKQPLELLKTLAPNIVKVGILYNPGEANSVSGLEQAKNAASQLNLEIITAPVNNTGEILSATQSIVDKIDAYYLINDNTVLAGQESLIKIALENKKPVIAIDPSGVEKGALATMSTKYEKVGEKAAEIAIRVINGELPGNIPVADITEAEVYLNKKTADIINIQIPDDLINKAVKIYE